MATLKQLLWFGLQTCLYCGSLQRQADGLCEVCSENLWSWQPLEEGLVIHQVDQIEVQSLFHWEPGRQEVLSKLTHALKGTTTKALWEVYAAEFWRRQLLLKGEEPMHKTVLVPSPSSDGRADHAEAFATSLAELTGASVVSCLSRPQSGAQKRRTRQQRLKLSMEWAANFTGPEFRRQCAGAHIVFVDDIVTTGATAHVAWQHLGKPRDFAVWSLAYRGLSCGRSADLL